MSICLLLLAFGPVAILLASRTATPDRYSFARGSRIWVEGTSTAHDWSCEAGRIDGGIVAESGAGGLTVISGVRVTIPVANMEGTNETMTGNLRNALDDSPNISFTLGSAHVNNVDKGRFTIEASGTLSIAGVSRTLNIAAMGQPLSNGRFRITGSVPFAMSGFGVKPPTAFLGAFRTHDNVTVRFDVTVEP